MEGKTFFKDDVQEVDPIKRFNHHSVISISLITKIEKDLTKKYASQDYGIQKYTKLFKDVKQSYKVLQLIVEEIESDLKIANLQFTIEPFKKINIFMINIMNLILDGFANIYSMYKQKLIEEEYYKTLEKTKQKKPGQTIGVTDQQEIDKLRKKHFEYKQKLNYFLNSTGETQQDFNYMQQLKKILQNKQVGERYKIPTTSHQIFTVKQKMQQIMQFADLISSENTKIRTEQFINMDLFKLNRASIQTLTLNIFKNFQNAFKYKYIKNIKNTSQLMAKQMNNDYKISLVSHETQTFENFGTKKANQAEQLLKQIQIKTKSMNQLKQNLQNNQKEIKQFQKKITYHLQQRKQFELKIYNISKNYEILQQQYNKYKSTSEHNFKQLKQLLEIKNKKISFYKQQVQKADKILNKKYETAQKQIQCTLMQRQLLQNKQIQTQIVDDDDDNIILRILKDKQQSLNKINILKEKKIKRLQLINIKLKQCLKNTLLNMKIQVNQQSITEQYLQEVQKIVANNSKTKFKEVDSEKIIDKIKQYFQTNKTQLELETQNQNQNIQKLISQPSLEQSQQKPISNQIKQEKSQVKKSILKKTKSKIRPRISQKQTKFSKKQDSVHFEDITKANKIAEEKVRYQGNLDNISKQRKSLIKQEKIKKNNIIYKNVQPLFNGKDVFTQTNQKWKLIRMAQFSCQVNIHQTPHILTSKNILQKQTILTMNNTLPKKPIKPTQQNIAFDTITIQKKKKMFNSTSKSRQNINNFTKLQSFQNLPEFTMAQSTRSKLFPLKMQPKIRQSFNQKVLLHQYPLERNTFLSKHSQLFRIQKIKTLPSEQPRQNKIVQNIISALNRLKKKFKQQYITIIKYIKQLQKNQNMTNMSQYQIMELQDYEIQRILHCLIAKVDNYSICQEILEKIQKIQYSIGNKKSV